MSDPLDNTGPPYPRPPGVGSNSIGNFVIGISPIGDIPAFDVWETVISQYANSPGLVGVIEGFAAAEDPTLLLQDFFDKVWNVDTAQGYGLDVWGRIVGVQRVLQVAVPESYFGFEEAGDAAGFDQESFYDGQPLTYNYPLADLAFRTLILAKAWANISDNSIPNVNELLMMLFGQRGKCYVTEGAPPSEYFWFEEAGADGTPFGDDCQPLYSGQQAVTMVMTYTFEFELTPVDLAIVQNSGVLPKPTGVQSSIIQIL